LSDLYHFYSLYSARKYVGKHDFYLTFLCAWTKIHARSLEQFSNGITIISLYLNPLPTSHAPPIEHSIFQVMKEASLLHCLPDNPFFAGNPAAPEAGHAVQEATYACESRWCEMHCGGSP
jgi:glutamate dehydrogenase